MKNAWITYRHSTGNTTTQPIQYFEPGDGSIDEYCGWLIESGEATEIIERPAFS